MVLFNISHIFLIFFKFSDEAKIKRQEDYIHSSYGSWINIFFVGRYFNPETAKRNFIFTTNWISHFRKWLDVSWWTKLVFKISYDKYEEIYKGAELASIKSTIEKIILKNIDNRISALGVSDYKAYVQNMDNNPYIIVEIWWVADLDQAKEIIGKTVELEFRLPKEWETSEAEKAQRKELVINLKKDIELSEWKIDKFADSRGSQNIFYNNVTGLTLSQLPKLFKIIQGFWVYPNENFDIITIYLML